MAENRIFGSFEVVKPPLHIKEKCTVFTISGQCSDEIELSFDDGNKLYVSENFLCYASPVFKAMFEHDCKEKESKVVEMKEKSLDDFQEFLLCLHPRIQKPVDRENVMRVLSLAEEYQVEGSITRCQEALMDLLQHEYEAAEKETIHIQIYQHTQVCLKILKRATDFGYEELITKAIQVIARLKHGFFTGSGERVQGRGVAPPVMFSQGMVPPPNTFSFQEPPTLNKVNANKEIERCKALFESLPESPKTQLLMERLRLCDSGQKQ